jgi:hypothetical protein
LANETTKKRKILNIVNFCRFFFLEFRMSYENVLKQDRQKNLHGAGSCSRDNILKKIPAAKSGMNKKTYLKQEEKKHLRHDAGYEHSVFGTGTSG